MRRSRQTYGPVVQRFGRWSTHPLGQIWLDALFVWCLSRALFLTFTFLAPGLVQDGGSLSPLRRWFAQDASQFISIAEHGYGPSARTDLFPLFPLLEHLLAPLFSGDTGLAGLCIANVAFLGALVVLRTLVARDFEPEVARRAMLYLAIFPFGLYFFAPTGDSLYLLLSLSAFAALRWRLWWLGGVLGGLAALTGVQAVVLLVPFIVELMVALRFSLARWWQALWAALIPAGTGAYSAYLSARFHNPTGFLVGQASAGHRPQWPWEEILAASTTAVTAIQHGQTDLGGVILSVAALLTFITVMVVLVRQLPPTYGLYTLALVLFFLLILPRSGPLTLQASGRLVAGIFPVFIVLARWGRLPRLHEVLVAIQTAALALLTIRFLDPAAWGKALTWWS